jgi:hypothetical protein
LEKVVDNVSMSLLVHGQGNSKLYFKVSLA